MTISNNISPIGATATAYNPITGARTMLETINIAEYRKIIAHSILSLVFILLIFVHFLFDMLLGRFGCRMPACLCGICCIFPLHVVPFPKLRLIFSFVIYHSIIIYYEVFFFCEVVYYFSDLTIL